MRCLLCEYIHDAIDDYIVKGFLVALAPSCAPSWWDALDVALGNQQSGH